ncbi:MAG: hypothetical protein JJ953_05950 [Gracilimonas sp.]|uniref:hypothetical protein n=1 Tax=Gracilimonas TaxID=649462 RepID=UPI001B112EE3|nr:hypothetical protein [Gracilimonas sp.]MBO6585628.1 hypothetical protein [Gracilimonas sp.]MBO6616625.1 hypothetical protein [Gracilimonas sp.]
MKYILIFILVLFTSCKTENSETTSIDPPTYKQELVEKGQKMANELKYMLDERGVDTGNIPSISVRNEPYLIFYNPTNNEVVVPWFEDLPVEMKTVMLDFANAADMEGREFFQTFFNTFFYYHEFAHWGQYQMDGEINSDRYFSENEANEITVAYLQSSEEGQNFLDTIEPKVNALVNFLENPAPDGVSEEEYFNENYAQLGMNAYHYGYYQFKFVKNALDQRNSITLDEIVERRSKN